MIVGYARCSTQEQNLDLQLDALKAAGCERIFTDKASGAKDNRPGLNECLKFLKTGDTLVTWKLDRVGRNLRHLVNCVLGLGDKGVGFRVLTGQGAAIDTTTAAGRMVFGIFASLAEFERELIRERVNAGIKAAKDRGVRFGRKTVITNDMIVDAKNQSARAVAAKFGVSKTALYNALNKA